MIELWWRWGYGRDLELLGPMVLKLATMRPRPTRKLEVRQTRSATGSDYYSSTVRESAVESYFKKKLLWHLRRMMYSTSPASTRSPTRPTVPLRGASGGTYRLDLTFLLKMLNPAEKSTGESRPFSLDGPTYAQHVHVTSVGN